MEEIVRIEEQLKALKERIEDKLEALIKNLDSVGNINDTLFNKIDQIDKDLGNAISDIRLITAKMGELESDVTKNHSKVRRVEDLANKSKGSVNVMKAIIVYAIFPIIVGVVIVLTGFLLGKI
tara:strand:+ start:1745 stop:2113 length:369 start_codon:yes stop_codon:yes gene_type:complete